MPQFQDNIYTGKFVASYIKSTTRYSEDVPSYWIKTYVLPNKFELKIIDIRDILDDKDFLEYYSNFVPRYSYSELDNFYIDNDGNPAPHVTVNTLYDPIVIVDNILIDGYSRAATLLNEGAETIEAFVKIN